jgi:iron complex outermembrane recepter protein
VPLFAFVNGDSASGPGVDLSLLLEPLRELAVSLSVSWNDLTWDSAVVSGGIPLFAEDERLNYSPEYTIAAGIDYGFALGGSGFKAQLATSANYTSPQDFRTIVGGATLVRRGDAMLLARSSFTVLSPARWSISLFGDNLGNEQGTPVNSPYGIADWSARVRPRTLGVQFEYSF